MTGMDPHPDLERMRAAIDGVEAPDSLRAWLADQQRDRRAAPRIDLRRRLRVTGGLAAAAAVAGAALAIVLPAGAPTVLEAAALAADGPRAAAPAVDPAHPSLLRKSVDGITFPTWSRYPWKPSGERTDTLDGRRAVTVFYDNPKGVRLGYTIVAGNALDWPEDSRRVVRHGVEVYVLRHEGRLVATWREHGHQCVISAPGSVSTDRMVDLAAADAAPGNEAYAGVTL